MLVRKWSKALVIGISSFVFLSQLANAGLSGSLSEEAIAKRLAPMGKVNILGIDASAKESEGAVVGLGGPASIYEDHCKDCHMTGLAGAPKLGNKGDWGARLGQGVDTLVNHAWVGVRAMPPKGNCLKCTEEDIKETVEYMLEQVN